MSYDVNMKVIGRSFLGPGPVTRHAWYHQHWYTGTVREQQRSEQQFSSYVGHDRRIFSSAESGSDISRDGDISIENVPRRLERESRLAVFVSGGGSNFKAIHEAIQSRCIRGSVVAVVTNAPTCGGAAYAQSHGIPVLTFPGSPNAAGLSTEELGEALKTIHNVDYIILAGYMKLIPESIVKSFPRAILNIHPGLLPSFGGKGFYGTRVHKAVISSGARFSGPTVHFIDEEYDTGPILAQSIVPVYPTDTTDTLAARVLKAVGYYYFIFSHCHHNRLLLLWW